MSLTRWVELRVLEWRHESQHIPVLLMGTTALWKNSASLGESCLFQRYQKSRYRADLTYISWDPGQRSPAIPSYSSEKMPAGAGRKPNIFSQLSPSFRFPHPSSREGCALVPCSSNLLFPRVLGATPEPWGSSEWGWRSCIYNDPPVNSYTVFLHNEDDPGVIGFQNGIDTNSHSAEENAKERRGSRKLKLEVILVSLFQASLIFSCLNSLPITFGILLWVGHPRTPPR